MRSNVDVHGGYSGSVKVHPTAEVAPAARLATGVEIGAYSVIGSDVELGEGTCIDSHVVIRGKTRIGRKNRIYPHAVIGLDPQIQNRTGECGAVRIGDDNVLREHITIHAGKESRSETVIGNRNYLMVGSHVAHDCFVADDTILTNHVSLAGHVRIEKKAVIGGITGIHQFNRVGTLSMVGGLSRVTQDIPPYCLAAGNPLRLIGLNSIGLKRAGVTGASLESLKRAFKILFVSHALLDDALREIDPLRKSSSEVDYLVRFIQESKRGFVRRFE